MPLNCKNNSRSYSSASGIRVNLLFCWCHMRFSQIDGCTNWLRNWQKKLNRPTPRNRSSDQFRLTVSKLLTSDYLTKRLLVSDIAKTFDVLGWFSPSIIKTKLLLQHCWEQKLNWDDPVSSAMYDAWYNWRSSLRKNVFTLLLWHISNHLFWTLRVSVMHQNMPSLLTDDWPLWKCWGHSGNIKYQGSSDKAIDDTSSWIMWTITYWLIYFTTRVKYLKFHLPMFAHGQIALLCTTGWMEALGVSSRKPCVDYHWTHPTWELKSHQWLRPSSRLCLERSGSVW